MESTKLGAKLKSVQTGKNESRSALRGKKWMAYSSRLGIVFGALALLVIPSLSSRSTTNNAEVSQNSIDQQTQQSSDVSEQAGANGVLGDQTSPDASPDPSVVTPNESSNSSSSRITIKTTTNGSGNVSQTQSETTVTNNQSTQESNSVTTHSSNGSSTVTVDVGENADVRVRERGDKVRIDFRERTRTEN